jgi:hypothetical protein
VGWQPTRFLADRAEAERALQLADHLDSVNAAAARAGHHLAVAAQSLHPARPRHAGCNPEAVRQRTGQPAPPTMPPLDPVFVALNPGALLARERSPAELHAWVRRDEEYASLGANVGGRTQQ